MASLSKALPALLALALAAPAQAVWHQPSDVVHGTANTLEKGELLVGIVTPVVYGLSDNLQVQLHPILWALLTPNVGARYRLVEGDVLSLALQSEISGTVLSGFRSDLDDPRPTSRVYGGVTGTVHAGSGVLISLSAGYQYEWKQRHSTGVGDDNAIVVSLGFDWLINANHLIVTNAGGQYSTLNSGIEELTGLLMYAYAFDSGSRLGVGVAFGTFPVSLGNLDADGNAEIVEWPAWPVIDWWARF